MTSNHHVISDNKHSCINMCIIHKGFCTQWWNDSAPFQRDAWAPLLQENGPIMYSCRTCQSFLCCLSAAFHAFISPPRYCMFPNVSHVSHRWGFYNSLHGCRSTGSNWGLGSVAALCRGLSRRGTVPLLSSTNGHGSDRASLRQTDTRKPGLAVGVIRLKVQTSLWSV